jgi:hypothetical protein
MGWPHEGEGFKDSDTVIKWRDCPDCSGRGWFLINPFATVPAPAGGIENMRQCPRCKTEYENHQAAITAA